MMTTHQRPPVLRILVADGHAVVRAGLKSILEGHPGWHVVAEAANGKEALEKALEKSPHILIIDTSLPTMDGAEVVRQTRTRLPNIEVLIFAAHESDELVNEGLRAGARAFLLKSEGRGHIVAAVEALAQHKPYFTGGLAEKLLETFLDGNSTPSALTPRERVVVQLVAEGKTNKEIGRILDLNHKTVETHRLAAMRKLKVTSIAALVRYAIRNKLVEP
jgi:DNA-binding NarL/FixJ family response regulator